MDFVFGSLVSWIRMMCGSLCSVCVRSWMPGRLELMHPVFHVTIFKDCVEGGIMLVGTRGMAYVWSVLLLGWYPFMV